LRAAAAAGRPSIIGIRLNEQTLAEHRLPDRAELDRAVSDRPVLLYRYCGHVAIANTAALVIAGITAASTDPPGGIIDRDSAGAPTGVLRETAIQLVATHLERDDAVTPEELVAATNRLAGRGLTSIGAILDAAGSTGTGCDDEIETMTAAAAQIPIRIGVYSIENDPSAVAVTRQRVDGSGALVRWLGVKRFGDGSFGGHTAAMLDPYADEPTTGTLRLGPLDRRIAAASLAVGGAVAVHAIGDRAGEAVLDLFADLIGSGADPARLRIEHASVLTRRDIARLGSLGVTAVVQPPFLESEAAWIEHRLGTDRLNRTYPFAALEQAGATLAGSSDCPVESPDPWSGMALARDFAGLDTGNELGPRRALALYTNGGAAALGEPEPLAVGSPADLIVVDRDPVLVSPDELRATRVAATYVAGARLDVDHTTPCWLED
jgi:predicted amidohydrolase YtcJ